LKPGEPAATEPNSPRRLWCYYLFVDGIAERLHLGQPREAVLAAWGILADGKKALLHLAPGTKEDTASCREFFQDMRRRGLPDALLVASDGAPGVIRAIEECLRARCASAAWPTR
jgi:putative transposase